MMGDQDGQEGADEISGAFEAFNNPGICSRCKGEGEAFTRCTRCPGGAMLQNLQGRELRDAMYIQDQYQEGSGSSMASSAKGDDEREGGTDDDDLKNGLSTQDGAEGKAEFKEPKKRKEDKQQLNIF